MPRPRAVHNAASAAAAVAASAWDPDKVVYVGMEHSNTGGCSQKRPMSLNFHENAGGCSQKKTASFDSTIKGEVGESVLRPRHLVLTSCPRQAVPQAVVFPRCWGFFISTAVLGFSGVSRFEESQTLKTNGAHHAFFVWIGGGAIKYPLPPGVR